MAHKTLTISEDAYNALARMKGEKESFTEVILRIAKKKRDGTLMDYLKSLKPDEEFAETLEEIIKERRTISLKAARL